MNKVSSKHHWENVWKFSNNKESYNFPPSRIERAKDKLKTFIYNEYYFSPGDKVLEAGCGDGAILFKLIEKYKIEGHGIDISENAKSIATVRERAETMILGILADNSVQVAVDLICTTDRIG